MNKSKVVTPPLMVLCSANHPTDTIYFCKRCARDYEVHMQMERVFFCSKCIGLSAHSGHMGDRYKVISPLFLEPYGEFIESIKLNNRMRFCHYIQETNKPKVIDNNQISQIIAVITGTTKPIYFSALRPNLKQTPITFNDLASYEYRKWILENKFWDHPSTAAITAKIEEYVRSQFLQQLTHDPWKNFTIDFGPATASPVNLGVELEGSSGRLAQMGKEKLLTEFFLEVTACFSNEDIDKSLKECARIEEELGSGLGFLLQVGKLKALELHDDCSPRMKAILKEVDLKLLKPNSRELELYYYYSAISEWEFVSDPSNYSASTIFLDARNKKHYRLCNSKNFITCLKKAIQINKNPLYLAARGIGHMADGDHLQAEKDFQEAQRLKHSSDTLDNNRLINKLALKKDPDEAIFNQHLHYRKTEYILGLCRVLQKLRRPKQQRRCCEQLVNREPKNISFRVMLLRVLLRLKDTDAARHELSKIKDLKELSTEEVEEFERKIELLKAYEQEELGNYSDAEGKLQHSAVMGQPSSSYWFNYASFLFKHRNERQRTEKALLAVNRALEIREKQEYFQLKYMLLFMMGSIQEAAKIQSYLADPKFNPLKEYVDNNI